jgi:hypothetical protein
MGSALVAMQLGIKVMLVLEQMKELKLGDQNQQNIKGSTNNWMKIQA